MIKVKQTAHDNVEHHRQLVAALHEERSAVWQLYCRMAAMKTALTQASKVRPLLARFSQAMIDYVSLGHFGIYEHVLLAQPLQSAKLQLAEQLYPAFSATTAQALRFNDTYDKSRYQLKTDRLADDLSLLGEKLAARMELEDRLCSMLLH